MGERMTIKYVTWLGLIVGCSAQSYEPPDAAAGPYPTVLESDFRRELSRAQVSQLDRCCERIGMTTTFEVSDGMPLTAAGSGARYDPAAAAACVAERSALPCRLAKEPAPRIVACTEVYHGGQLQPGEECALDWDCAQREAEPIACVAMFEAGRVHRVCRPATEPIVEGDPCAPESAAAFRCEPPLICNDADVCVMPKLGDPCVVGAQFADTCPTGLVCDRSNTQRCIEPVPVGGRCDAPEECEGLACRDGVCLEPVFGVETCISR
jgi:hypothetical protein